MRRWVIGLAMAAAAGSAAAAAPSGRAEFDDVLNCRSLSDSAARLACYDGTVAKLAAARDQKDIFVVDREQVRQTKRSLFGLSLPNLDVLGDKNEQPLTELDGVLASVRTEGDGSTTFVLTDGSRWHQEDDVTIGYSLKPGGKVLVRRGALGSFRLSVDGHFGVRVRRVN